MPSVAGLPATPGGARTGLPRPAPPGPADTPLDRGTPTYRQVERGVERERVARPGDGLDALSPSGVEPVSTQSVLDLRQTAAPVSRIAEAYGLTPAAVHRMLRAVSGELTAGRGVPGRSGPGGPGERAAAAGG